MLIINLKKTWMLAVLAVIILAGALSAQAALVGLNPIADAFVVSSLPSDNYGAGGALSIAAPGSPNGEFASVMRFDSSVAKTTFDANYGAGNWTIQSATLRLTAAAPGNPIFNASAAGQFNISWMQNDSWVEGTGTPGSPSATGITYNSLPSFLSGSDAALGTFNFSGATSGMTTYTLNLSANFVNDLLAGNLASLRLFAADTTVSYLFNSRSFGTAANRPLLEITAVPEPMTAFLLVSGLAVAGRKKRSR